MNSNDADKITTNERKLFSAESQSRISSVITSIIDSDVQNLSTWNNEEDDDDDDNIDWNFVSKQLETKLRTSSDMTQSYCNENQTRKSLSHPIINHRSTVDQQTSHHDTNENLHSNENHNMPANTFSHPTSTLDELLHQLNDCRKQQAILLEQISQLISQSKRPSPFAFFLPLNHHTSSQTILSLQEAFEQHKSSFIQQSKNRVNQIYRQNQKSHHRIIPSIESTKNTYLRERRRYEHDHLCAMIVKQQNRQSAKIYGDFRRNHRCQK